MHTPACTTPRSHLPELLAPFVISRSQPGLLQGMPKLCHKTADFAELQLKLGSFWPQGFNNNIHLEVGTQHKVTSAPKPPPGCWAWALVGDVHISSLIQKCKTRERSLLTVPSLQWGIQFGEMLIPGLLQRSRAHFCTCKASTFLKQPDFVARQLGSSGHV